jgi:preprotein translocase SecE subunit
MLKYIKLIFNFLGESYREITHNVTWESMDKVKNITFIVLFFIITLSLGIFVLDYISKNIVEYLYKSI